MASKKNDNFLHFANTSYFKNVYVATPLLTPNCFFVNLLSFIENIDVEKKLKIRKKNKDKERGSEREKRRGNQQKRAKIDRKTKLCN